MKNSLKYRVPPIKRTRNSFIDDVNSKQDPRIDLGQARETQIRRDKDKVKSLGVTLYDIDFAVKSFIDNKMQIKIEDNGESINVPTIYANAEKWASIQKDGFLKDKKGKTFAPLITFRRSDVTIVPEMRKNKVATTNQIRYIMKQPYNTNQPYDKFSLQYGRQKSYEYFTTPVPDYVDVTYDFIMWCEYQTQLNYVIENFIYYGGQSFGEKNFFKFATNLENVTMEDNNTTGQDRLVRANFQLKVHGYLVPKDISTETTTKRLVSPNKIKFVSETFSDIDRILSEERKNDGFRSIND